MSSIAGDALPNPSTFSVRGGPVRNGSTFGKLSMSATPDAAIAPRIFTFDWSDRHGAVADAVRRHYREHFAEAFTIRVPRTNEIVTVGWLSPPRVTWKNETVAAGVTGEFEELPAHE